MASVTGEDRQCSRCSYRGPVTTFAMRKDATGYTKTCKSCARKVDCQYKNSKENKTANKENEDPNGDNIPNLESMDPADGQPVQATEGRLPEMSLEDVEE